MSAQVSPLVSVIVPIYNVEKYLPKCLDSILSQTLKAIEVIGVDDGLTDCSGEILDNYANRDSRVRVVHQLNAGLAPHAMREFQLLRVFLLDLSILTTGFTVTF